MQECAGEYSSILQGGLSPGTHCKYGLYCAGMVNKGSPYGMHCRYGLYYTGMINKGSPRGEDQEADHLHIAGCDPEESRDGYSCT